MERPDRKSQPQRATAERGEPRREPAQAPPHHRVATKPAEHTDMRFEPQLEEPGYGHGV